MVSSPLSSFLPPQAVWGISDTVVLIDQERLMQSAGGLTVQSAFEAAEGAMLQAAQAVVDLVPSSGVTDARTAAAVDSLEALRSPSRHTFFGAGRAPLRAGGGAGETAVSVATAVSAAVHDAMGSPFLGPGALAVAQQVVCLVGVPPAAAAAWEAVCRAAAADTVAALVGPGCRAEFVAVEAAPEGADSAASTEVSARLLVSAVQPAGSGTAPSIASANTAAAAMEMGGAAGDDARPAAGSWRRDAMSKLAGGSRLRSWDAAHKAQAAAAAPAAAVTAAAAQAAPAPQAAAEAAAPPKPQPPPPALETSGVGRGEGSGLKKTTQLSPKGAPFAGAAESAAPPPPPAAAAALAAPKESPAPEPATPAPVAAAAAAVAPPDEPEAPQQPPRPAAPAAAASSAAAAAAAVDSLASASSAAAATSRPAPAPSSPGRPNWGDSDQPPVLDDILRGDFSDSSSEGDGESVGDWEDVEEDQRGGLPLLGWFKKARKKKRPEASLRAAVRRACVPTYLL